MRVKPIREVDNRTREELLEQIAYLEARIECLEARIETKEHLEWLEMKRNTETLP